MKRITKIDGTDFIHYSKYLDLEEKYKGMLKLYSDAGNEIKKLKDEIAELMGERDGKQMKIEMLEEELKKYKSEKKIKNQL